MKCFFFGCLILISVIGIPSGFAQTPNNSEIGQQWQLPQGATARFGKGTINAITYSPDGTRFAVASGIGIWVYDANTDEPLALLAGHTNRVSSLAYSPNGQMLASGSRDNTVRLWDTNTGQPKFTLSGHSDLVTAVVYSPDGATLASGSRDNTVRLWDTNAGTLKATFAEHTHWVNTVAYSPDGSTLVSAGEDTTIRLWDPDTGEQHLQLTQHTGRVPTIAYSPDGATLASGSKDTTIRLWDTRTGALKNTLTGHTAEVVSIAYSPDGATLASGSKDTTIRLWDTRTGALKNTLIPASAGAGVEVTSVAYSPDGATLASADSDNILNVWDAATGIPRNTLTGHTGGIRSIMYSPDGTTVVSASEDKRVRLWDVATGHSKTIPENSVSGDLSADVRSITYSPDGRTLASVGGSDNTVQLWDANTGQVKATLAGHTYSAFNNTFRDIVHLKATLAGHTSWIVSVVYSPDGRTLASAGGYGDKTVRLWNVANGQPTAILTGHTSWINAVTYSPDGSTVAGAGGYGDNTVRLWDANTGRLKATLVGHTSWINAVAYSPDGTTLASGSEDTTVRLWDANTGHPTATLIGHTYEVRSLTYAPNGTTLASGDAQEVRLWDAATGYPITSLIGPAHGARSLAYSPDSTTLASGGEDGTVLLWNVPMLRSEAQQLQQDISEFQEEDTDALTTEKEGLVRLIYFLPSDRVPQPDIDTTLDRVIKDVQLFYARQLKSHGFNTKTFTFETETTGAAVVHHINGEFPDTYYHDNPYHKVFEEIQNRFDTSKNIHLIFLDMGGEMLGENVCGLGGAHGEGGGMAVIPAAGECFSFRIVAHELGHALGLYHDFREPNLMSGGIGYFGRLTKCNAEFLDVHPLFNPSIETGETPPVSNTPATVQMSTAVASSSGTVRLGFEVSDADGLYQANLLTYATLDDPLPGFKLLDCKSLNPLENNTGDTITTEFVTSALDTVFLQVIDVHGSRRSTRFEVRTGPNVDVNADGVINIQDLVLVAASFGQSGASNRADVNGDKVVNIADLVLVAGALGGTAAAPAAWEHGPPVSASIRWTGGVNNTPTRPEVQAWLTQAKQLALTDAASQRGILVLERLLAALPPQKTALLPNYPNPFNPETWIPYQLSHSGEVTVRIYAATGNVVRTLALGHQDAGEYKNRGQAAYWDGRNDFGETVASGLYFYTLTAGDFSATRKMLILK